MEFFELCLVAIIASMVGALLTSSIQICKCLQDIRTFLAKKEEKDAAIDTSSDR